MTCCAHSHSKLTKKLWKIQLGISIITAKLVENLSLYVVNLSKGSWNSIKTLTEKF